MFLKLAGKVLHNIWRGVCHGSWCDVPRLRPNTTADLRRRRCLLKDFRLRSTTQRQQEAVIEVPALPRQRSSMEIKKKIILHYVTSIEEGKKELPLYGFPSQYSPAVIMPLSYQCGG